MSDLFVDNIKHQSSQGSGTITLGASGETVSLGTTAGGEIRNGPAFSASLSANQSVSNATWTKLNFNTEHFDTDNAYDNSTNYRFTVPTGKGGKYLIEAQAMCTSATDFDKVNVGIYKNGSLIWMSRYPNFNESANNVVYVADLSESDYIELFVYQQSGSAQNFSGDGSNKGGCHLQGLRLLGI